VIIIVLYPFLFENSYRSMLSVVIRDAFPVGLKGIRWPLCVKFSFFFAELLYSGLVGSSSRSLAHAAASLEYRIRLID